MLYLLLKHLHITCVTLSGLGFVGRGVLMLRASPWLQSRFVRTAPHVVDTLLLSSALALTVVIGQYPFTASWLTAKFFGLLLYILLGTLALKRGPTAKVRASCFVLALLTFAYIVSVALRHNPAGFFEGIFL
jgi:uncharacterized membrane protein SirB2